MKNSKITNVITAALILSAGFFLNCKTPFSTRKVEPPENQQRTNWLQPTDAGDVLTNLRHAIQDRNLSNYLKCFTDSPKNGRHFGFRPDNSALIRYPGVWDRWSLVQEQTYITNVFHAIPKDSALTLIYLGEGVENPLPDSTIIIREYEFNIGHTRDTGQFPRKAKGRAEFRLSLSREGFWAIYYWLDDGFEGSPSWSDVKATFIQ